MAKFPVGSKEEIITVAMATFVISILLVTLPLDR